MNCYVCATRDATTTAAVAICRHCNAGLCLPHLREAAATQQAGGMNLTCIHDTWMSTSASVAR